MNLTTVSIDTLDLRDDHFQISYMTDRSRLCESIQQIGIIHPVIVRSKIPGDRYQIVSGFQRIQCCLDLNISQVNSVVYPHDELSDSAAILLTVHQTATSRPLNLVEKSLALQKLKSPCQLADGEIISNVLPLLGLQPNDKIFRNISKVRELTEHLKMYIVQNNVALNNAILFLNFNEEDQNHIARFISPLRLGTNRLKEFLVMIDEICRRDDVQVNSIIDKEMDAIIADTDVPTPQKTEAIRKRLKEKRYPTLVALEQEIHEKLKLLKLPPNLILSPPPFLEGDRLNVRFDFSDKAELEQILRKLDTISDTEELKSLLDML